MGFGRGMLALARRGPLMWHFVLPPGITAPRQHPPVVGVTVHPVSWFMKEFRSGSSSAPEVGGTPQPRAEVITPEGTPPLRYGVVNVPVSGLGNVVFFGMKSIVLELMGLARFNVTVPDLTRPDISGSRYWSFRRDA